MFRVILLCHERIADAYKDAAISICGPQCHLDAFGITSETDFERLFRELSRRSEGCCGTLVMTDLLGGSPTQLAARLSIRDDVEVVTGLNLPMLLQVLGKRQKCIAQETDGLRTLVEAAVSSGREGIDDLKSLLAENMPNGGPDGDSLQD